MSSNVCPQCNAPNRVSARFCAECGAPLLSGISTGSNGSVTPALQVGAVLQGRYQIINELGRGGFGAVYRAWDANLNRYCALKENLDTSADAQRQFAREATVLAGLSHANLPRVTDHFTILNQGQYLVMDYVEGEDLLGVMNNLGVIDVEQALKWITQVADALAYLHGRVPPVVHRDIKPANIRITPEGKAMLVDFGLVKLFDPHTKTTLGARAVTPGYAPPEQYGQGKTDTRTDIYALGATLYTILTGREPLESVQRVSGEKMLSAHLVKSSIPEYISQVIEKAMALGPEKRYQKAADFREALLAGPLPGSKGAAEVPAPETPVMVSPVHPNKPDATVVSPVGEVAEVQSAPFLTPAVQKPPSRPIGASSAGQERLASQSGVEVGRKISKPERSGAYYPDVAVEASLPKGKKTARWMLVVGAVIAVIICLVASLGIYSWSASSAQATSRSNMEKTGVSIGRTQTAARGLTQTAGVYQQATQPVLNLFTPTPQTRLTGIAPDVAVVLATPHPVDFVENADSP